MKADDDFFRTASARSTMYDDDVELVTSNTAVHEETICIRKR
jgi:hypothetical protein